MKVVAVACALVLSSVGASAALAADFVGSDTCQGCHPEAYSAWLLSKHAHAKESLGTQQKSDARCLSCHSPNRKEGVSDVGCETCHGAGQFYSPEYVMKDAELARHVGLQDPGEKLCRNCHDASSPSLRPFDFKTALKAIDHWSAERARRKGTPPAEPADAKKPAGKKSP
jgi:hypothetical protein